MNPMNLLSHVCTCYSYLHIEIKNASKYHYWLLKDFQTPTHSQNSQPIISLSWKKCWGNSKAELLGVPNVWFN